MEGPKNLRGPSLDRIGVEPFGIASNILGLEEVEPLLESDFMLPLRESFEHKDGGDDASSIVGMELVGIEVEGRQKFPDMVINGEYQPSFEGNLVETYLTGFVKIGSVGLHWDYNPNR